MGIEMRVVSTNPLECHHRVLDLLGAIVLQDALQLGILAGIHALPVLVDRLELLISDTIAR